MDWENDKEKYYHLKALQAAVFFCSFLEGLKLLACSHWFSKKYSLLAF